MRVAFDVAIPSRTIIGVGVYATELGEGLRRRGLDLHEWRCGLGPPGRRALRLLNGWRLVAWYQTALAPRAGRERIDVYRSACSVGPRRVSHPVVMLKT